MQYMHICTWKLQSGFVYERWHYLYNSCYDVSRHSKAPELSSVPLRVIWEREGEGHGQGQERMNFMCVVVVYISVVLNKSNYY